MKNNPFIFDIESGGLSGDQSSILSISYSSGEESKTLIASPEVGSRISRWSEKKVWEPLKNLPGIRSEKDILKDFLGVLKQQTSVAGWNIGYTPTTQSESTSGFDIPMLITRAKKYGLQEEYQKEFSRVNIRDIGKEWSVKIASEVSKYPDLVDPQLYEQAAAFNRVATTKEALEGKSGTLLAEAMAPYRLAGWKQETVASLLDISYQSHQSSEDISALRKIMESSSSFSGPESVSAWNRLALKNRLVSAALSGAAIEKRTGFFSSLEERAKKFNILPEFQSSLQGEAKIRGASLGALQRGEGFREVLSEVKAPLLSRKSTRLAIGLGIGATALLLKPLSLFSGKDDQYNTIEGLAHGGEAEKSRRKHSDFGSGYKGLVNLFRGTKEKITEHLGLLGQANLSKEHRLVEDILERVRKAEYPSRPSRLTSSFWSISPKEAERYAGTSGYLSVTKGGEETFFTRQSYYSDLFKELYSPSRTKDTLVEKARTYWKGIDPSNKMEDIEALIPGVATAKKVYQIETTINKKRWNALHLKSMKQHSEYSAKPGRKHTGQAGKILG